MARGLATRMGLKAVAALALLSPPGAAAQAPAPHTRPPSELTAGTPLDLSMRADAGAQIELNRAPADELAEHRRLDRALAGLLPQRRGVVDAYVVSIALDSDPVFGREARAAGEVLQRRYDARGRSIVLAGGALPRGTPASLAIALARIAELMDESEDALILYTTSHGAPFGLYYNDGDSGYGAISPFRLLSMLNQLGLSNRLLIISACHAGVFVPALRSETGAIVVASAADRTSFGCAADNDWTFFGDALINHALRKPQPLAAAFAEANALVSVWEARVGTAPSQPQLSVGAGAARWLGPLERRMPAAATQPVGRPALETSRAAAARR